MCKQCIGADQTTRAIPTDSGVICIRQSPVSAVNRRLEFLCHPLKILYTFSLNMRFKRLSLRNDKIFRKWRILRSTLRVIIRRLNRHKNHIRHKFSIVSVILLKSETLRSPECLLIAEQILPVIHIKHRILFFSRLITIRRKHTNLHLSVKRCDTEI